MTTRSAYGATARSTITADLVRVDHLGVYNLTKAFQDYNNRLAQLRAGETSKSKILIAKFKSAEALDGWEVRQGTFRTQLLLNMMVGWMLSLSSLNLRELSFQVYTAPSESYVFTRGGYVELSKKLSLPLGSTLDRYEGLVLSVGGNGRSYVVILEAGPSSDMSQSKLYFATITTKTGFVIIYLQYIKCMILTCYVIREVMRC
ncbi:hypothetical protein Bca4012_070202 [Brassica carinata]